MFTNMLGLMDNIAPAPTPQSMLRVEKLTFNSNNTYKLTGTPIITTNILFVVNGIIYTDISYNASDKTLTYKGEVPLAATDDIKAIYVEAIIVTTESQAIFNDKLSRENADKIVVLRDEVESNAKTVTTIKNQLMEEINQLRGEVAANALAIENLKGSK